MYWNPPDGYELENAQLLASQNGLGSILTALTGFSHEGNTKYDSVEGHYTTTIPTNLLSGLLGLASELELSIIIQHAAEYKGWTSEPVSIVTNAGLIAQSAETA